MKILLLVLMLGASVETDVYDPMQKPMTTDEVLGVTPWRDLTYSLPKTVSMYELIVHGEKYANQHIRVSGFLRYKVENNTVMERSLYADRDSLAYGASKNSIRIYDLLPGCDDVWLEDLDGEYLEINGVFRTIPEWYSLTPIDFIRLIKSDRSKAERLGSEILCRDSSLRDREAPEALDDE